MPARPAPPLGLRDGDRDRLAAWTRSSSVRAGLAQRARIVLLAAEGKPNSQVALLAGVSLPTKVRRALLQALSPAPADRQPSMDVLVQALALPASRARWAPRR